MTSRHLAVLAALLAAGPVTAQLPFGVATPAGGHKAELFGEPLWLGNFSYGYRIENGPPGGAALLVVSVARQDTTLLGLQLYPSLGPGDVLVTDAGTLDASGRLVLPRPLAGPEIPALAGLCLYAQVAVAGPGGLGSTQGLLIEAALHPMLAFGHSSTGFLLIDVVLGTSTPIVGLPPAAGAHAGVFANGGRDLFVAASQGLFVVDTTAAVPTAVSLLPGQSCHSMAWDRVHRRLYVTRQGIDVVDGDRASPTFGTVLASVPASPAFGSGKLATTADGTRLMHLAQGGSLERHDADPASPTYLQPIPTPPPMWSVEPFTSLDGPHVAPDGSVVTLVRSWVFISRTELHRFDVVANAWIDHDPVAPGTQPLSFVTHALAPSRFTWYPTRNGSAAHLIGNSGTTAAMSLDLGGTGFTLHPSPVPPMSIFFHYHGLTPTGRYLLANVPVQPNELKLVDVATGAIIPLAAVPPFGSSVPLVAWR